MPRLKKSIISLMAVFLCTLFTATNVLAYTPSVTSTVEIRNRIAKNWTFLTQGYKEYNCLAWALGNTTEWVWPWSGNPSITQVDIYMRKLLYQPSSSNTNCDIYAYGTSTAIVHFAHGRGYGPLAAPIDAKWGSYELFTHSDTDPYYTIAEGGSYGILVRGYTK